MWNPENDWEDELQTLFAQIPVEAVNDWVPFPVLDVGRELDKMKRQAAAGPDGVGVDLLWHLHARGYGALVAVVNRVVKGEETDLGWDCSLLALLPKVEDPGGPSDLRPIAISSALSKLVMRMIMHRCFHLLRRPSDVSACGKHRQAADLLGVATRLHDMSHNGVSPSSSQNWT